MKTNPYRTVPLVILQRFCSWRFTNLQTQEWQKPGLTGKITRCSSWRPGALPSPNHCLHQVESWPKFSSGNKLQLYSLTHFPTLPSRLYTGGFQEVFSTKRNIGNGTYKLFCISSHLSLPDLKYENFHDDRSGGSIKILLTILPGVLSRSCSDYLSGDPNRLNYYWIVVQISWPFRINGQNPNQMGNRTPQERKTIPRRQNNAWEKLWKTQKPFMIKNIGPWTYHQFSDYGFGGGKDTEEWPPSIPLAIPEKWSRQNRPPSFNIGWNAWGSKTPGSFHQAPLQS